MEIVKAPNPILNTVCEEVDLNIVDNHNLAFEMIDTLIQSGGLGLAAPQVGYGLRMFIMRYGMEYIICVNPEITRRGRDKVKDIEGCLSIPGKRIMVERSKICELEYTELSGKRIKLKLRGLDARCAQHEMDHLNGVLITEK
mgnify:CR=1 FL=1